MKTKDVMYHIIEKNQLSEIIGSLPAVVTTNPRTGLMFISSFPPRECGIATYTTDLIQAIEEKFNESFEISIVPVEASHEHLQYERTPRYILDTSDTGSYINLADNINKANNVQVVSVQHEFGLFKEQEEMFGIFLNLLKKDVIITFHTVLPNPDEKLKLQIKQIAEACKRIIVMTNHSANILMKDYGIEPEKIKIIQHGTHLLPAKDKDELKEKYKVPNRRVLSTFGLLGPGKNIETTLHALPTIIKQNPDVIFLIIGKTHPSIVKNEGEQYREHLKSIIKTLEIEEHVLLVDQYLPIENLLEYLLLTDIYLFTSNDRHQAVSGTFSYAISSGCPIISTPIPHVREVLKEDMGVIIDFEAFTQLADAANNILENTDIQEWLGLNSLQKMVCTSWQNSAIAHANIFKIKDKNKIIRYSLPQVNLDHIERMTTDFGMIQFAKTSTPDLSSGYTLDDNARALVALSQHFELYRDVSDLRLIGIYLNFIGHCLQENGKFLNYMDSEKAFTSQNAEVNLDDSNGRAAWALGHVVSLKNILPNTYTQQADDILEKALPMLQQICSTRALSFTIKGLHLQNNKINLPILSKLADRLVAMYETEAEDSWLWFEKYLTYGNSAIPEALLCAYISTQDPIYKEIAKSSFDFLLSKIFVNDRIHVISNKGWAHKGICQNPTLGGEQPIDITYTILALNKFEKIFPQEKYALQIKQAFDWFLGKNHLNQIVYNPVTGGCYDGIEEEYINLNQGAESTVSYLLARLTLEKLDIK
ncbi:glycosyltransferase [Sphingobacterium sp. SYP-B4668]|uniref:glycosyltransferase n=1 Tax=Sphingobacterium sp. SYP-B4668 TaxID=2996035 RepID=UPI0022DD2E8F|nr:glycosyltransferase [Sphingobacterium sp. SYP-B4668]